MLQARRVSRELSLLVLYQYPDTEGLRVLLNPPPTVALNDPLRDKNATQGINLHRAIRLSIDTLRQFAEEQIEQGAKPLMDTLALVDRLEYDHERYERRKDQLPGAPLPVDPAEARTAPIRKGLEQCLQGLDAITDAFRIPELVFASGHRYVQQYVTTLLTCYVDHDQEINDRIQRYSQGWRLDRLVRMDRCLLQLALSELFFVPDVDPPVTINEIVELAKRYSTEDSYRFINGILRTATEEYFAQQSDTLTDADPEVVEAVQAAQQAVKQALLVE